jgi:hypothetical protein
MCKPRCNRLRRCARLRWNCGPVPFNVCHPATARSLRSRRVRPTEGESSDAPVPLPDRRVLLTCAHERRLERRKARPPCVRVAVGACSGPIGRPCGRRTGIAPRQRRVVCRSRRLEAAPRTSASMPIWACGSPPCRLTNPNVFGDFAWALAGRQYTRAIRAGHRPGRITRVLPVVRGASDPRRRIYRCRTRVDRNLACQPARIYVQVRAA